MYIIIIKLHIMYTYYTLKHVCHCKSATPACFTLDSIYLLLSFMLIVLTK